MGMDKLKTTEQFPAAKEDEKLPEYSARLLRWIEKELFFRISSRINFLLNIAQDGTFEIIVDGNTDGDDGNWRIDISSGDWIIQKRESGAWVDATKTSSPS